ncbi:hypothetical protein Q3G72_004626 [Acer saccharum]|nr:hypothetical protein Q3G72_004626 [Acer saccharum]
MGCGTPKDFKYTESITGIDYILDATFTNTGVCYNISSEYNSVTLEQPFLNVRSFPEGTRNCYTLKPARGNTDKLFIRSSFMYGNFDGQNKVPSFDLLLDYDEWDSVQFNDASTIVTKEILHVPKKNYLDVYLVNTGSGTPFISAIELRPLKNNDTYPAGPGLSLLFYSRLDSGSKATNNEPFRLVKLLKDDGYDRIWSPYTKSNWVTKSTSLDVYNNGPMNYLPPSIVMQTAAMPANGNFVLLHFIYCTSSSSSSSHHRPSPSSSSSSSSTITIINHHLPHHPTNPNPEISLSSTTIISKSLFLHSITSGSDDLLLSLLDLDDLNHLDLARSDLHLALTIWICVHLHSRWSGLVLVLRGGGFGFGDCGGGGGLKGCLGFLGFLG